MKDVSQSDLEEQGEFVRLDPEIPVNFEGARKSCFQLEELDTSMWGSGRVVPLRHRALAEETEVEGQLGRCGRAWRTSMQLGCRDDGLVR